MEKLGKLNKFELWEFVEDKFVIEMSPWTKDDLLTSLGKLKRTEIFIKYSKEL